MRNDMEKLWMGVISAVVLAATFFLSWHVLVSPEMSREQANLANLILGYAFGLANVVIGYYFMSSKSSREKTKIIKDVLRQIQERKIDSLDLPDEIGEIPYEDIKYEKKGIL